MSNPDQAPALPVPKLPAADVRVRIGEADAISRLHHGLVRILVTFPADRRRDLHFLCIGTDRSTGDCLGPLVGSMLVAGGISPDRVHGTLAQPVHAANLSDWLAAHCRNQAAVRPLIVAVDACLGQSRNVGSIAVGIGSLKPGAGVNKSLPAVGDVYLTGTVNVGGFMEYFVLQNTRLHLVMEMAEVIAAALIRSFQDFSAPPRSPRSLLPTFHRRTYGYG